MIEAAGGEVKIGEVGAEANKGAAADQASVNGIADGMKEIVAAGGKDALKAAAAAGAAGGGGDKVGAAAGAATNPIAAAIGTDAADGADFAAGMQNSSEKIAAAIVLRGMAKDGKFSLAAQNDANQKAKVKSVVHQRRW